VLLDGDPALYTRSRNCSSPVFAPGALVVADNMDDDLHPDAMWIRNLANRFVSTSITPKCGTEYSVWVGAKVGQASTS
jgi:hypothetical protein